MTKQQVTDDHEVASAALHLVLVDGELAARARFIDGLMQEQFRVHLEDLVAQGD